MYFDDSFPELICAISKDNHYIKDPISLKNCHHFVCKLCFTSQVNTEKGLNCKICGAEIDPIKQDESKYAKDLFKKNLSKLFSVIEKQTTSQIMKLEAIINDQYGIAEFHLQYIEEEIEIRIESLKNELDEVFEKFKIELAKIKTAVMSGIDRSINNFNVDVVRYKDNLDILRKDIEKKNVDDENRFYNFQNNLIELKKFLKRCNNKPYELKFNNSNVKIDDSLVGEIVWHKTKLIGKRRIETTNNDEILQSIKSFDVESMNMGYQVTNICELPNAQLVCCINIDMIKFFLAIYDENLNLVKKLEKINGEWIRPIGIAVANKTNRIYISEGVNKCVIWLDLELNNIKSYGSKETDIFSNIQDLCCNSNSLYVCDYGNHQLCVLTHDLTKIKSINLDYHPWKVKASNTTLCVNSPQDIYFYSLEKGFKLLRQYSLPWTRPSLINSYFYEFAYKTRLLYCYDSNGVLVEEINMSPLGDLITGPLDGCLVCFESNLLMSFEKLLIAF